MRVSYSYPIRADTSTSLSFPIHTSPHEISLKTQPTSPHYYNPKRRERERVDPCTIMGRLLLPLPLMSCFSFFIVLSSLFIFSEAAEGDGQLAPALFMFGDSLVDVGNNNHLKLSLAKADFPHNGVDFPGKKPTGRFSNGKNAADFLGNITKHQTLILKILNSTLSFFLIFFGFRFTLEYWINPTTYLLVLSFHRSVFVCNSYWILRVSFTLMNGDHPTAHLIDWALIATLVVLNF